MQRGPDSRSAITDAPLKVLPFFFFKGLTVIGGVTHAGKMDTRALLPRLVHERVATDKGVWGLLSPYSRLAMRLLTELIAH